MSSFNNHGGLWDNQRKYEKKDPDFVGCITIGGTEYQLVGWMSSSSHPKAPTINLRLGSTKNTKPVFMGKADPKGDSDDPPF